MDPSKFELVIGYTAGGEHKTLRLPPSVLALAALAVASSWYADRRPPAEVIQASASPVPLLPVVQGLAPGQPDGEEPAVITPLNVRDPTALIMGVAGGHDSLFSAPVAPPPPPAEKVERGWTMPEKTTPEPSPACEDPYSDLKVLPLKL